MYAALKMPTDFVRDFSKKETAEFLKNFPESQA